MFSSQQTSFRGNLLLIMQMESTVPLIWLRHRAGVCNPNTDRWTETQTFQRKESSTKFIEMLETFLLKPFLFTLPKRAKVTAREIPDTTSCNGKGGNQEMWVNCNHFGYLYFLWPCRESCWFQQLSCWIFLGRKVGCDDLRGLSQPRQFSDFRESHKNLQLPVLAESKWQPHRQFSGKWGMYLFLVKSKEVSRQLEAWRV